MESAAGLVGISRAWAEAGAKCLGRPEPGESGAVPAEQVPVTWQLEDVPGKTIGNGGLMGFKRGLMVV